jgi:hypothetical protein
MLKQFGHGLTRQGHKRMYSLVWPNLDAVKAAKPTGCKVTLFAPRAATEDDDYNKFALPVITKIVNHVQGMEPMKLTTCELKDGVIKCTDETIHYIRAVTLVIDKESRPVSLHWEAIERSDGTSIVSGQHQMKYD